MNHVSSTEVHAEVGYDVAKDFTFLRTTPPDFVEQLAFTLERGSKEDTQIRTLLEERRIVDFTELSKTVTLPSFFHKTFGIVGAEEDETLTPENYPHLVLFGRANSGAHNLIRFWFLWAARQNMPIISVANPDLYNVEPFLPANLVYHLNPDEPLREQVEAIEHLDTPDAKALVLIGPDFIPDIQGEDAEFIGHIQNRLGRFRSLQVFSIIHLRPLHEHVRGADFFGSEGEPANVSYAAIGDINERTAKAVGVDVPTRNRRGVAWFNKNGTKETKRVRTFLVPKIYIEQLSQQQHRDRG